MLQQTIVCLVVLTLILGLGVNELQGTPAAATKRYLSHYIVLLYQMSRHTLLICTGATFPFDQLFEVILASQDILLFLHQNLQITSVRVQYGPSSESGTKFKRCLSNIDAKLLKKVDISGFGMTDKMAAEISASSIVISHAGWCSLLCQLI